MVRWTICVPQSAQPEQAAAALHPPQLLWPQFLQAQAGDWTIATSIATAGNITNKRRVIKASSFE
jgi:hypothetical protein